MSSFEEKYYLENPSRMQELRRDISLLLDNMKFLVIWALQGHRIRKALKKAAAEGRQIHLEDMFGNG